MKKIIIDNCQACEPVNRLVNEIIEKGFEIVESKLEDYHFKQLYFKVNANEVIIKDLDTSGFSQVDRFLICNCHWSRIEFVV
jgi:hypothetical protein